MTFHSPQPPLQRAADASVPLPSDSLRTGRLERLARRAAFAGPVLALPLLGVWLAARLTIGAPGPARPILLALLFGNLLYLALTGWPGVLGAVARLRRRPAAFSPSPSDSRTAVLFPVYNEDPAAVFTAAEVMARAIADHGLDGVDLFVLSDTQDPALAAAEHAAYTRLGPQFCGRLRYRRRPLNTRRKVGNIADFCSRWGSDYDYMVVLDADSLMAASTIATLIGLMDTNPRTGLIQTVPYAVGRETLFARIQQFAARLYTPLLVEGLAFWQGADSNYWGHNAIIRIAPFMAHCELPTLPGREPFGGDILCHDVVEAALMRRGGWEVWMLPGLPASYEALPANMVDFAQRERRWCQGNLQHLGVLPMPGLRAVGRYHLALGVLNYVSGPLMVAFTVVALADGLCGGSFATRLLSTTRWEGPAFVALTSALLYAAKLCSLGLALADRATAELFGGRLRLVVSAALEQACAMVSAPVLLLFYTRFIAAMLFGTSVQWSAQPRDDRGLSWSEGWRRMRLPFTAGAAWLLGAAAIGGPALTWSATLIPGLLLATPVAVWTSQRALGLAAKRFGLFLTEDELTPSPILRAYERAMGRDTSTRVAPEDPFTLTDTASSPVCGQGHAFGLKPHQHRHAKA